MTRQNVNFQSETGDVDFQPSSGRFADAVQNVNWSKAAMGVGAAAAVAGAAYAANRYRSGRSQS
jgi:hypothetical protein